MKRNWPNRKNVTLKSIYWKRTNRLGNNIDVRLSVVSVRVCRGICKCTELTARQNAVTARLPLGEQIRYGDSNEASNLQTDLGSEYLTIPQLFSHCTHLIIALLAAVSQCNNSSSDCNSINYQNYQNRHHWDKKNTTVQTNSNDTINLLWFATWLKIITFICDTWILLVKTCLPLILISFDVTASSWVQVTWNWWK